MRKIVISVTSSLLFFILFISVSCHYHCNKEYQTTQNEEKAYLDLIPLGSFNKQLSMLSHQKEGVFSSKCSNDSTVLCKIFINNTPIAVFSNNEVNLFESVYEKKNDLIFFEKLEGKLFFVNSANQKAIIVSIWKKNDIDATLIFRYGKYMFFVLDDKEQELVRRNLIIFDQEKFLSGNFSIVKSFKRIDEDFPTINCTTEVNFDSILNTVVLSVNESKHNRPQNNQVTTKSVNFYFDYNKGAFIDTSYHYHETVKSRLGISSENYNRLIRTLLVDYYGQKK